MAATPKPHKLAKYMPEKGGLSIPLPPFATYLCLTNNTHDPIRRLTTHRSVADMGSLQVVTPSADRVSTRTKLLRLGGSQVANSLGLQWVTEKNSPGHIGARHALLEGIMDDHGTLAVAGEDDLGGGALRLRGLDERGHGGSARRAEISIALSNVSFECLK